MQSIETYNFKGKKALIRVDFNVPLDDEYKVTDDTRIKAALPTIEKILNDNGSVILMSHLGRPKGVEERFSLKHIVNHISKLTGRVINFADDCIGENAINMANGLKEGEILLLENLRFHPEEKKGDLDFAKRLAMLGDCWVNDAFGTAHRAHSSTAIISQFFPNDKMFGYLINNELKSVDKFINSSVKPVTAIMGGAKVSSKIGIIKNLMNKVDNIIIGGGMTFTFVKAMGGKIGNSLVENDKLFEARELLKEAKEKGVNFIISVDALCGDKFDNNANTKTFSVHEIPEGWIGLDAGEESIKNFKNVIENSKTILWNGPVGVFEMPSFEKGTKEVAYSVAKATSNGVFTLIGGGDSVAAANQYGVADKVSYVSTGGGALLEYIEGKKLPGIEAVRN